MLVFDTSVVTRESREEILENSKSLVVKDDDQTEDRHCGDKQGG
jgi:hypothetical protein